MVAHKTQAVVNDHGQVLVDAAPFKPGDRVDVIVLPQTPPIPAPIRFPLRGPYRFDDPFSSVAAADEWDAAK